MTSDAITKVLKENDIDKTIQSVSSMISALDTVQDVNSEYVGGHKWHICFQ